MRAIMITNGRHLPTFPVLARNFKLMISSWTAHRFRNGSVVGNQVTGRIRVPVHVISQYCNNINFSLPTDEVDLLPMHGSSRVHVH